MARCPRTSILKHVWGGIMSMFAFAVVAGIFGAIGYKLADTVLFRKRR